VVRTPLLHPASRPDGADCQPRCHRTFAPPSMCSAPRRDGSPGRTGRQWRRSSPPLGLGGQGFVHDSRRKTRQPKQTKPTQIGTLDITPEPRRCRRLHRRDSGRPFIDHWRGRVNGFSLTECRSVPQRQHQDGPGKAPAHRFLRLDDRRRDRSAGPAQRINCPPPTAPARPGSLVDRSVNERAAVPALLREQRTKRWNLISGSAALLSPTGVANTQLSQGEATMARALVAVLLVGAMSLGVTACGRSPGGRAVSGGLLGAGAGAGVSAITGGNVGTGALVGGGVGAAGGALTAPRR
jgi:osmotically inducible lipoprotein OsmB